MTEWEGCEKPVLERLVERGWEYVPGSELPRAPDGVLIEEHLREFVEREARNIGVELKDEQFTQILLALQGRAGMEGYKDTLRILKDGAVALDIKGRGLTYLKIIDYESVQNNKLVVSNQVRFLTADGAEKRLDVVLFVNGIPIAAIECKNPAGSQNWHDAYLQLRGYEHALPELFRFVQFNVALGAKARVYPTMPWVHNNSEVKPALWRSEQGDELMGVIELLTPSTLLDMLKNFVFIHNFRGRTTKVMARYMQYRAANEIYRAASEKKGGVVWHWQGSGKTLTMIFAAYKLYTSEAMEKPTVFFVMDRKELQDQFAEFLNGLDFGGKIVIEKIESVRNLDRVLRFDSGRGKRGFFVMLIQKFKERDGIDLEEIEKLDVVDRENIFVFVDEAHRTQYGILAARMKKALKNARFYGFTGTPLLRSDKNTQREFGPMLDVYFIESSVKDGYTVPMVYTFAREQGVHLDVEQLREAVAKLVHEGEEEEVARRLRPTREFMKNETRMRRIAKGVVDDLLNNRTYKGMLVAVDRESCVLYRRYIMEYLRANYPEVYEQYGEEFVEVVMTYNPGKDSQQITEYREAIETRYGKSWDDVNKLLRERFRDEQKLPRLMIVTDMLLTGYDVPVLEVMYLDKIMTGHTLLQAIARTNRPYRDKGFGVVIDYVGIFKIFKETLHKYYAVENTEIENAALSTEILVDMLTRQIDSMCREFPELCRDMELLASTDRNALYGVLYSIYQREKESAFETQYRELHRIWNALGGNPIKAERRYLTFYRAVSAVYILHRRLHGNAVSESVLRAVRELNERIREMSKISDVKRARSIFIDEAFLNKLKGKAATEEQVVDMTALLNMFVATVKGDAVQERIFGDLVEYIESAIRRWRDRKSTIEELYKEELKAFEKMLQEQNKIKQLRLSPAEYAIIKTVNGELNYPEVPEEMRTLIAMLREQGLLFRGWHRKADVVKNIREKVRVSVLRIMVSHNAYDGEKLNRIVDEIMNLLPFLEV
ncbi:MAG: HsdR family type I site-specific deoxyribonuclease [Euryarchaeota archaeon]|nr:HsdR family type I site-specific deoxyribonuclease [Euryarchaeota archaeon]